MIRLSFESFTSASRVPTHGGKVDVVLVMKLAGKISLETKRNISLRILYYTAGAARYLFGLNITPSNFGKHVIELADLCSIFTFNLPLALTSKYRFETMHVKKLDLKSNTNPTLFMRYSFVM